MNNLMDKTVDDICQSMQSDPDRWVITTHTLNDKSSGVKYWLSAYSEPITEIWNGTSRDEVFTEGQGRLLYNAFCKMKEFKATEAQEKVIESMKPKPSFIIYEFPKEERRWWEFWK